MSSFQSMNNHNQKEKGKKSDKNKYKLIKPDMHETRNKENDDDDDDKMMNGGLCPVHQTMLFYIYLSLSR